MEIQCFGACFAKADTYVPLEVAQTPYVELNVKSDVTVPLKVKSSYKIKTIRMPSTDRIVSYKSSDTKQQPFLRMVRSKERRSEQQKLR